MIERTFGCCRWVWNKALRERIDAYERDGKTLPWQELCKRLTVWKKTEAPWLYEVNSAALQQTIRDLDRSYQNFFARVKKGRKPGFPRWKRRSDGNPSYRVTNTGSLRVVDGSHVRIPSLGSVKCRITQPIEGRILNATVRRVPSGKYFVSLCCTDVPEPEMPTGDAEIIGIDTGVSKDNLIVRSDGVAVPNGRHLRKAERKLRREQRRLSRMQKGSANREKQKRRVARVHENVSNQRRDAIHKATTQAVRDSKAIAVEDLNVAGMMRNHHLAKSVADASMSEVHRQLEYKCGWYGRDFVKVDRFFASTQLCHACGAKVGPRGLEGLKVHGHWDCPECGARNDRDLNAARNIAEEGSRILAGETPRREVPAARREEACQ